MYLDIPAEAAISSLLDAMMGAKLRAILDPLFAEEGCVRVLDLVDSARADVGYVDAACDRVMTKAIGNSSLVLRSGMPKFAILVKRYLGQYLLKHGISSPLSSYGLSPTTDLSSVAGDSLFSLLGDQVVDVLKSELGDFGDSKKSLLDFADMYRGNIPLRVSAVLATSKLLPMQINKAKFVLERSVFGSDKWKALEKLPDCKEDDFLKTPTTASMSTLLDCIANSTFKLGSKLNPLFLKEGINIVSDLVVTETESVECVTTATDEIFKSALSTGVLTLAQGRVVRDKLNAYLAQYGVGAVVYSSMVTEFEAKTKVESDSNATVKVEAKTKVETEPIRTAKVEAKTKVESGF